MKFEHFKKINYFLNLLKIKKQKLKLGIVSFEITPIFFNGIKIYEYMEMRYSRQDTTKDDESKLSTRLEKLKWKWTLSHIIASLIVIIIFYNYFYFNIYTYYLNLILPSHNSFLINNEPNNFLIDFVFDNVYFANEQLDFLNKEFNIILIKFINL